jgi:hypothetical protein
MAARRGSSPASTFDPEPVPTQKRLPSLVNRMLRVQWPSLKFGSPFSDTISCAPVAVIAFASYL